MAALERTRSTLAGLVQSGVSSHDILVVNAPPSFDGGYEALDEVLAFGATAVLCGNDTMALGVIRRAAERGVAVPGELSIVGFDDIDQLKGDAGADDGRVDKRMLGMETVRRLRFCIVEREMGVKLPGTFDGAAVRSLVPTRLVRRESTGVVAVNSMY